MQGEEGVVTQLRQLWVESVFVLLGTLLLTASFAVFKYYTEMPNVRPPQRYTTQPFETYHFELARESGNGLLSLPACPPRNPIYEQALRTLVQIPRLGIAEVRYIRDLQYTFELASSAYMQSCLHMETMRFATKLMNDMQLLASEMYVVARRLDLSMQVRFPRECDDPMLTSNRMRGKSRYRIQQGHGTAGKGNKRR